MRGQVVVVTGAGAGVGRAAARAFAEAGAGCVALLSRNAERLADTADEVVARGARALPIALDVADPVQVEEAAERIEREAGPIAVWVNNAMATIFAPLSAISPEEFARVTTVTYLGTVHGTMSALKRMRARNAGTIVQVGSALAYRSIPLQSAYCGAKHAIRGFTDSVRCELIHDNSAVRISMVQLPGLNTTQFEWARTSFRHHPQPVGTVYQPEVAARAIVWAATHARRELYVGMPSALTIVANKLAPGLLDRLLAHHAYEQQFTAQPIGPDRPDNLFHPVSSPYRARGSFDARACSRSLQLWASLHRRPVGLALALAGCCALAWAWPARQRH
ncbi:SDR family oxidoreductase [Massilia horti]|uniref:SDR family NAD(P)-dependent oxidoreductase n=1 Tax=Massilia horti TaxID=2562153 RepID=A0A4Y9T106_9BURK|nr:SDR family oxidoreductase [Massilia horti]TFW32511.1 SDR family NAD(P)-dependent oxidoreductase [Massilia horti]